MKSVLLVLAGLVVGCSAQSANAVCIYHGKLYAKTIVSREFKDSPLVVRARLFSSKIIPGDDSKDTDDTDEDILSVVKLFKGKSPEKLFYYSEHNSGMFPIDAGKDYLLFLSPVPAGAYGKTSPAGFNVNYECGQSKPWDQVTPLDLESLVNTGRRDSPSHDHMHR